MAARKKVRPRKHPHTIMIVDVQKAFPVPPGLVEKIQHYSTRFGCRIFTKFVNPPGSLFRKVLKIDSCYPGSEDTELQIPTRKDDLVFVKAGYGLAPKDI